MVTSYQTHHILVGVFRQLTRCLSNNDCPSEPPGDHFKYRRFIRTENWASRPYCPCIMRRIRFPNVKDLSPPPTRHARRCRSGRSQPAREKSLVARRSGLKGAIPEDINVIPQNDSCEFESSHPKQPVRPKPRCGSATRLRQVNCANARHRY